MKKKIGVLLIIALIVFAFVPALTVAQDSLDDDQETGVEETEDTADENEENTEEETQKDYQNLEELLADLETNENLNNIERITLERKLNDYDESLEIDSISSVVDKILNKEIDLGQGFVILKNLEESVNNGFAEEEARKLINDYDGKEDSGEFAFQTALELRKLSREDMSGENTKAFADEVASIIEEKGEMETSELKQLAAEYRKEAREERREEIKAKNEKNKNSASKKSFARGKSDNASENAGNKSNNGKGNSNNSKSKGKGNSKSSAKSSNSNSNK